MTAHGKDADEWFNLPRESRIFMTSHFSAKRVMEAIAQSDAAEEAKRKRPPPRGRGRRR